MRATMSQFEYTLTPGRNTTGMISRRFLAARGYTLMEVIVTFVLIGVLAGGAALTLSGVLSGGKESSCKTDRASLETAQEANYARSGTYQTMDGLVTAGLLRRPMETFTVSTQGTPPAATSYTLTGVGDCSTL